MVSQATTPGAAPLSDQRLYFADDALGIQPVMSKQLLSFAGSRQLKNCLLMHLDTCRAELPSHGIAQPTFEIMILHRQNSVVGLLSGGQDYILTQGLYTICVNNRDPDVFIFQRIRCLQRFV